MLSREFKLYIFTDSKSLFDTMTRYRSTKELQLMDEISDIRRAYKSTEMTNIAWIRTDHNIADSFTRHTKNYVLQLLSTGNIQQPVEEGISKT